MHETVGQIPRRYVASLDVLGFTTALRSNLIGLTTAYATAINIARRAQTASRVILSNPGVTSIDGSPQDAVEIAIYQRIFHLAVFSDSIFVFTDDESTESLAELCEFCFVIYREFLAQGLALRGGIAAGEAIVAPDESLYVGQAIVDAWKIEQSLDVTGIVLHPGLNCEATTEALATFKVAGQIERKRELRLVPNHRSNLVTAEISHNRQFQILRQQAGPSYRQRYEYSEPVVAAMFRMPTNWLALA